MHLHLQVEKGKEAALKGAALVDECFDLLVTYGVKVATADQVGAPAAAPPGGGKASRCQQWQAARAGCTSA